MVAWMSAGWILRLHVDAYLLLGVPLVLGFQRYIRREGLVTLWVRRGASFELGNSGILIALSLLVVPAFTFATSFDRLDWTTRFRLLCSMAGAPLAAFSLRHLRHADLRKSTVHTSAAITVGIALIAVAANRRGLPLLFSIGILPAALRDFLLYFTVGFVLEEVAFRGALDGYLYGSEASTSCPWISALFVSALWGIWHLPLVSVSGIENAIGIAALLAVQHSLIGIPLSLAWRSSGVLALPAAAHALVNAYRNAVLDAGAG